MMRQLLLALFTVSSIGCATSSAGAGSPGFAEPTASVRTLVATPAAAHQRPLRVMTFNIQSGSHGLEAVAALIRSQDPDVVALQEVDKGTTRCGGVDQARELARLAGYPHAVYFRATSMKGGEYGVALLSRYEVVDTEQRALPVIRGLESRTVARAVLQVDGEEMSVYVTHLSNAVSRSQIRMLQARYIARWMAGDPRPKILMGDFNDSPDSPALLFLSRHLSDAFARAGVGAAETYPLPFPLPSLRLDYVLASRELKPLRAFVVRKLASDHWPLVAEFDRPGAPSPAVATTTRP